MQFSYEELKNITGATSLFIKNIENTYEISTDTRTIKTGNVYIPLKGESFDGEKFIQDALNKGANGYFTTNNQNTNKNADFALLVEDTKIAYLKLANYFKKRISPTTIAVTGSSGKTTTKEILSAIFKANRITHNSILNHNNEIGLCQTLLSMNKDTEVLIVEMGMRGLGEIELLSKYAEPDFAVITNIGTAHIGILKSRENIAKAKCEVVKYLNPNGTLITLSDSIYDTTLNNISVNRSIIRDFKILNMSNDYSEFQYKDNTYKLPTGGEYAVLDALLGIETALLYGLTPEEINIGLAQYKHIDKRFDITEINNLKLVNDSYNANPDSMKAAIKAFLELYKGNKILVLADMKELGENEIEYHKELGKYLNEFDNISLITIGALAKNISDVCIHKSKHFCGNIEAAKYIKNITENTSILLKGSRSMKLEEVIEEIKK